jgi:adenylate kinase family enzyme
MQRVAVVGSGGSGKSTFARRLAELTSLPLIPLDNYYWHPGWVTTPKEEWRTLQTELAAGDSWIIDGNYGGTYDVRFSRADTVIFLALPRRVCIPRVVLRTAKNWHRSVQAEGCPEHFDMSFLLWLWHYPRDARPLLDEALAEFQGQFTLVELKTRGAIRDYLDSLS